MHVAGTSVNRNHRTTAAYFANHALPRLLDAALNRGCHGMAQSDGSGIRGDVDVKGGVGGHAQGHVARAGAHVPHVLGRAFAVNVAAARFGMESAIDAVRGDVAGSGADIHVACTGFLDLDVTAARFDSRGARELAPADVSRARLEAHFAGEARQLQIARTALEIDV